MEARAFHDVVRAREDKEKLINQAKGYQADILPKARGEAQKLLREAEGYKEQRVLLAQGEAARFLSVLAEYEKAREVTRDRLHLETVEKILPDIDKVIIGGDVNQRLLPLLPLTPGAASLLNPRSCRRPHSRQVASPPKITLMRTKLFGVGGLVLVLLAFIVARQVFFTVNETDQVIITQFGEYKRTIQQPGLAWKMPFLQTVNRFDRRILTSDAPKAEYLTQDKKRLVADPVTRWRISDPLLFYKTVRDESGARARLDDLVLSELRREVASHNFDLVIGGKRETIMDNVAKSGRDKAKEFGIELVDVRIKRADLPQEVQLSVFQRMQAEREREAKRYRSEGDEESAKLKAETDKQRTILLAQAKQDSDKLRGEGDGTATRVYAEAYGKDAEFYAFVRSLQAYEQFLGKRSTLVLPADSDLFRYLSSPQPRPATNATPARATR